MKIRVYYEDTDIGGIVYYANYFKFIERARSELFFSKGLTPYCENEFFVVKNVEAQFIKPAKFGDVIEVKTMLSELKNASLILLQEIFKDGERLFSAKVRLAYLSGGTPAKMPNSVKTLFLPSLEQEC